jgi:hypothetical protein
MNDDNLITVSCKLNPDTVAAIERAAEKAAVSRSEYLRTIILASITPAETMAETRDSTVLFHQILFVLDRIHNGMYMMAEMAETLSPEQIRAIEYDTDTDGIDFLSNIDERIARTRRRLVERLAAAPPVAGK